MKLFRISPWSTRWQLGKMMLAGLACIGQPAAGIPIPPAGLHAVVDVTVVDLNSGCLRPHQTVIWDRSRIVAVGPVGIVSPPTGSEIVSGAGRYLLPGLFDCHVHVPPRLEAVALRAFIAYGVTAVRDMSDKLDPNDPYSSDIPEKHRWSAEAIAGLRIGPRILATPSFILDGPSIVKGKVPAFFGAATPADARRLVHYLKDERGVDFIKVYSRMPRESFFALMDEAKRSGVVVAGHKPLAVSFVEAADAGMKSMEHAREMLLDSFPGAAALQRNPRERNLPPTKLREILATHQPGMLQEIFAAMTRNGAYYCPTHVTRLFDASVWDRAYVEDARLRFIPGPLKEHWMKDVAETRAKSPTEADRQTYRDFFQKGLEVTAAAHAAGVKILAGTDASDSFSFYGSSLHDELELMVRGGLAPLDALRTATLVPAEYFGRQQDFGPIAAGRLADLVLLDGNPLEDIRRVREIRAVIFNGRCFDRAALDGLLAEVEAAANR